MKNRHFIKNAVALRGTVISGKSGASDELKELVLASVAGGLVFFGRLAVGLLSGGGGLCQGIDVVVIDVVVAGNRRTANTMPVGGSLVASHPDRQVLVARFPNLQALS